MNRNSRVNNFVKTLIKEGVTVAFAESMTCGLAAHLLSTCKGTNDVLMGSVVCYNVTVKKDLLGVSNAMLKKYSAESRQVTDRLARGLKKIVKADVYAAITGLASAGGSEETGKPVGTVFYTVTWKSKVYSTRKVFRGTPLQIREKACMHLYALILKYVKGKS